MFKAITKRFNFSRVLDKSDLPAYAKQYIKNEIVLSVYKTDYDHGVFTDKKIVLFDNKDNDKQIYTIPYKSISCPSINFKENSAELDLFLDSGHPVKLNFSNMSGDDKLRLRLLYVCLDKLVNNQEPVKEDMEKLLSNNVKL